MSLGETIYALRMEKNMSQGDLADALPGNPGHRCFKRFCHPFFYFLRSRSVIVRHYRHNRQIHLWHQVDGHTSKRNDPKQNQHQ